MRDYPNEEPKKLVARNLRRGHERMRETRNEMPFRRLKSRCAGRRGRRRAHGPVNGADKWHEPNGFSEALDDPKSDGSVSETSHAVPRDEYRWNEDVRINQCVQDFQSWETR
jgi:hypothetical protein